MMSRRLRRACDPCTPHFSAKVSRISWRNVVLTRELDAHSAAGAGSELTEDRRVITKSPFTLGSTIWIVIVAVLLVVLAAMVVYFK